MSNYVSLLRYYLHHSRPSATTPTSRDLLPGPTPYWELSLQPILRNAPTSTGSRYFYLPSLHLKDLPGPSRNPFKGHISPPSRAYTLSGAYTFETHINYDLHNLSLTS
ncbi:hypothetical protein F5877DRAFT_81190 [Lentinula edodes]|nr:hypothetical protein F5877DRAFT_81190 [Lentinula edodes]